MRLISSAFDEGENIPTRYTCDGENINPPLAWYDVPAETKSFVLVADDHEEKIALGSWVVFNIKAQAREIPENFLIQEETEHSSIRSKGPYLGPCPIGGTRKYFFKLYALDVPVIEMSDILEDSEIVKHTIATAILTGRYEQPLDRLKLWSESFKDGDMIPEQFTCDGANVSPHLAWYNVPEGTKSFALVMEDLDARAPPFLHWIVIDIDSQTREISENSVPADANVLLNSLEKRTYFGPCPFLTEHHYAFKLFALNVPTLPIDEQSVLENIQKTKIAETVLTGRHIKHLPKPPVSHEMFAPTV